MSRHTRKVATIEIAGQQRFEHPVYFAPYGYTRVRKVHRPELSIPGAPVYREAAPCGCAPANDMGRSAGAVVWVLAAAGASAPVDHSPDGVNLLPLLRGEPLRERPPFIHAGLRPALSGDEWRRNTTGSGKGFYAIP